jgi:hypothetical protein
MRLYKEAGRDDFSGEYATIVDESMMVGNEKLLLTLGVSAVKDGHKSLQTGDVRVLYMSVRTSWNIISSACVHRPNLHHPLLIQSKFVPLRLNHSTKQ